MIAKCCVIYALMIHGESWQLYDHEADPLIQDINTQLDCQREAAELYLRKGNIKRAYCVYLGNPNHWIVPPYDWPLPVIEYLSVPEMLKRSGQTR